MFLVDNAVIMAAGTSSRFAPLSYECPKALIEVRGEILIERQIRQLQEAGVPTIYLVVGYKKEKFSYLAEKFGVKIVENPYYLTRNNNASIWVVRDVLKNSYICSADNYFTENPFEREVSEAYYSAIYANGETAEWCMQEGEDGYISSVSIGGSDAWFMLGHAFWSEEFSRKFLSILEKEYELPETENLLWESIYCKHLSELKLKIRKYPAEMIFEFDTLDELRVFDPDYVNDSRSPILKSIATHFGCREGDLVELVAYKTDNLAAAGFTFRVGDEKYRYSYQDRKIVRI